MATTANTDPTPLRMLIDDRLSTRGVDLETFVSEHRADGDSWADIAAKLYAATGKTVSVGWLIKQCGTTPDGSAA